MITGDKNYGPVLFAHNFFDKIYDKLILESPAFTSLFENQFISSFGQNLIRVEAIVTQAAASGVLDSKTKKFLLHGLQDKLMCNNFDIQREFALKSLGVFRFLAKVHKQVSPMPVRKIEGDTFNPLKNVTVFCAKVLNRIASKLPSVLMDSKQLISFLHSRRFPYGTTLVTADLLDFMRKLTLTS